jgi:hypothetical protein
MGFDMSDGVVSAKLGWLTFVNIAEEEELWFGAHSCTVELCLKGS